jgi:ligand-binding sensor domain-containing protein
MRRALASVVTLVGIAWHLHGLPHIMVARILADSRGSFWLCETEGLARFDGQGFTTYGGAATAAGAFLVARH